MLKKKVTIAGLISILIMTVVFNFGAVTKAKEEAAPIENRGYAHPEHLISAQKLKEIKDQKDVVVIDFRSSVKYHTGHIPGAVQISRDDLEDPDAKYDFFKASPERVAKVLGEKGIDNDDLVVAYDNTNDLWAVRVWWILKMYGHEKVKLLDGGLGAWKSAGYDVNRIGSPDINKTEYEIKNIDEYMNASAEEVEEAIDNPRAVILDTRAWGEYTGDKVLDGAGKGGRIKNSIWIEWTEALTKDGTFKTAEELARVYTSKGINSDKEVIMPYCQGAIRSAHTTFVLRALLGLENVRNYDGSWVEWSNEGLPIETGLNK